MIVRKIVIRFCNNIKHFSNEINKQGGDIFFRGGWNFSKLVSVGSTFIREMRVRSYFFTIVCRKALAKSCLITYNQPAPKLPLLDMQF